MAELKFSLEFGECNGYMSVECYVNDKLIAKPDPTNNTINTNVELPFKLVINVSGKNPDLDTLVKDGTIVSDKYVKINKIYLARYPVNDVVLRNICQFTPYNSNAEQTTYFYRNGAAVLTFNANDELKWHLLNNKYL